MHTQLGCESGTHGRMQQRNATFFSNRWNQHITVPPQYYKSPLHRICIHKNLLPHPTALGALPRAPSFPTVTTVSPNTLSMSSTDDASLTSEYLKQKHRVDSLMQKTEKNLEKRSRQLNFENATNQNSISPRNDSGATTQQSLSNLFRNVHHNLTFLHNSDWSSLKNHISDASHLTQITAKIDARLQNLEGDIARIRMGLGIFFDDEERDEFLKENPGVSLPKETKSLGERHVDELTETLVGENHELKSQLRVLLQRELQYETRIAVLNKQLQERVRKEATGAANASSFASESGLLSFSSSEPTLINVESPLPTQSSGSNGALNFQREAAIFDSATKSPSSNGSTPPTDVNTAFAPITITHTDSNDNIPTKLVTKSKVVTIPLPNLHIAKAIESVQIESLQSVLPFAYWNELKSLITELHKVEDICQRHIYERLRILCNRVNFFHQHCPVAADGKRAKGPRGQRLTFVLLQIFGSNVLWNAKPSSMQGATTMFLHAMRKCLTKYSGYENNGEAGTYLCVFSSPKNAARFIRDLQLELLDLPYPNSLLTHPLCAVEEVTLPEDESHTVTVFRGFRVSSVMHSSEHMKRKKNPHTLRDEYSSPDVQLAARILNMLRPGQMVIVAETKQLLQDQAGNTKPLSELIGMNLQESAASTITFANVLDMEIPALSGRNLINQSALMDLAYGEEFCDPVSLAVEHTAKRVIELGKQFKATQYRMNLELELDALKRAEELRENNAPVEEIKQVQRERTRQQLHLDNAMDKALRKVEALQQFTRDTEQLFVQNDAVDIMDQLHHRQHLSIEKMHQEIRRLKSLTAQQGYKKKSKAKKHSGAAAGINTSTSTGGEGSKTLAKPTGLSPLLPKATTFDERSLHDSTDESLLSLSPQSVSNRKRLTPLSPVSPRAPSTSNSNGDNTPVGLTNPAMNGASNIKRKAPPATKSPYRMRPLKKP